MIDAVHRGGARMGLQLWHACAHGGLSDAARGVGVDVLHCSQRRFWEPWFPDVDGEHGLNVAGWARKLTGAATISAGSVGLTEDFMGAFGGDGSTTAQLDNLTARMERDQFDLVAIGRALIADPGLWSVVDKIPVTTAGGMAACALSVGRPGTRRGLPASATRK